MNKVSMAGHYKLVHKRNGEVLNVFEDHNDITNAGLDAILDIMFHGTTQITTWYMGLIDNSGYSSVANSDTMSSHAGWNEFTTYSQATRPEWTEGASSSQVMTNSSAIQFSITGSGTLKGILIASNSTKGGTTGTLWSTALFSANLIVTSGDTLELTYSISASRA